MSDETRPEDNLPHRTPSGLIELPAKSIVQPVPGEEITSVATGNTFTIGPMIGEGNFGVVYQCTDVWNNDLAAKILKPKGTYDAVRSKAVTEFATLQTLRHPFITYVFDAFEYRDTFYIITEKCYAPLKNLFNIENFNGQLWIKAVARCLLQAIHYLHVSNYVHQDIHSGNVLSALVKDEMTPSDRDAMVFKLGDLGVTKLLDELDAQNTRAVWLLPPEVLNTSGFGPIDHRVDIYHAGLLFLELAYSKELRFTHDEIMQGKPRAMALQLPPPLNFALEKALRRHVQSRTATAMEFWQDMHAKLPAQP